jgi:N-acetylmuramoyl-L-alanine amidase
MHGVIGRRLPLPVRGAMAAAALALTASMWATAAKPGPGAAAAASPPPNSPPPNSVVPFGSTGVGANAVVDANAPIVALAAVPDGGGYWLAGADGGVFAYGDAAFLGSAGALHLNAPIVGMAAAPGGRGYWLVARDGGIFTYGSAAFWGSTGSLTLNAPIVGMAATPDGGGYWLVAADGGVFSYGDAAFWGSAGGTRLNAPIVGMAAPSGGAGYWLVARDGGVFTYGTAGFWGSAGVLHLDAPVVGMAATTDGAGYWMVGSDGGVFTYGDAAYEGSLGGTPLPAPVVGMAAAPGDAGYWLAVGSEPLAGKVVGIDPGHNGRNYTAPGTIDQPVFNGTGTEPCDTTGTATDSGYTEAAFNFAIAGALAADLEAEGASVVVTRPNNDGVGPCVTTRAAIINQAHADVAVDIHADGGPTGGRGFTVLEPVPVGPNDAVVGPSQSFGSIVRDQFAAGTAMPISDYSGVDGIQPRNDLAGLNLSEVPKVLIESGNMRNGSDASLLVSPSFQQEAAASLARAITQFLTGRPD